MPTEVHHYLAYSPADYILGNISSDLNRVRIRQIALTSSKFLFCSLASGGRQVSMAPVSLILGEVSTHPFQLRTLALHFRANGV